MIRSIMGLLVCLALAGCVLMPQSGNQSSSAADLGPGEFSTVSKPADVSKELRAGVRWLWESVARLQEGVEAIKAKAPVEAATLENALDSARSDCLDAETAAKGDDAAVARTKWRQAREALGKVALSCLPLAVKYGLPQLAAAVGAGQ